MAINKNFVVKNGLEVDGDLLFANSNTNRVGIGSTNPQYDLQVVGDFYAETIYVDNNISAGGTTGVLGSLLRVGSNGIEWSPPPTSRVAQAYTASAGQTVFNFVHTVGLIDVFINGVKLSSAEFIDSPTNITLVAPAFAGDNVELIGYTIFGVGAGVSGIAGITVLDEGVVTGNVASVDSINFVGSDVTAVGTGAGVTVYLNPSRWAETNAGIHTTRNVGIGTTLSRFPLEVGAVGASGTTLLVNGDARITGILSVGQGTVTINGNNNTITASNIVVTSSITGSGVSGFLTSGNLSSYATLSYVDDAVAAGGGGGGGSSYWSKTTAGINTLSSVGIGTTNPVSALTVVGSGTSTSQLYVTGVSTLSSVSLGKVSNLTSFSSGNNPFSNVSNSIVLGGDLAIFHLHDGTFGTSNRILVNENNLIIGTKGETGGTTYYAPLIQVNVGSDTFTPNTANVSLGYGDNTTKLETIGTGITVTGTTFTNQLNVSGVSTFNSIKVPEAASPFTSSTNNKLVFGNDLNILSTNTVNYILTDEKILSIGVETEETSFASVFGLINVFPANDLVFGNNSYVTLGFGTEANNTKLQTLGTGITVTGTTFTNQLNVSGVSTFVGNVNITGVLGVSSFGPLNVSGVATISQGRIQANADANLRFGNAAAGSGSGRNIAIGDQVLVSLSGGQGRNIGIGELSYYDTTTGQYNIGIGERSGQKVSSGSYNVILGSYDGNSGNLDIRTSSNNVVLADGQGNIRQYINSSGNVGIKTTVITEALTVAGIVSATGFYGSLNAGQLTGALPAIDGSALIGVVGSGSGVVVQEDGTPVGTAGTINFGSNVSVSFASGIATVSGASSVSAATTAYNLAGTPNLNIGIVTTTFLNATDGSRSTNIGATYIEIGEGVGSNSGPTYLDFHGPGGSSDYSTRFIQYTQSGIDFGLVGGFEILLRNNATNPFRIKNANNGYKYFDTISNSVQLYSTDNKKFETTGYGVSVYGGVNAPSGIITASSFSGSGSGLTNLPAGQLTGTLPALDGSALLNVTAAGTGVIIHDDGVNVGSAATIDFGAGLDVTLSGGVAAITASGGSLQSRTTVIGVTTSIANNGIGNTNITGFKSYALMKVGLSTAGWLRLYTDSTSRANDVSRSQGEDPAPGSGVIAEVITTGISTTQIISPFVMGGNLDNPADTTIYASITNLSGTTQAITANLTILQLEA